MASVVSICNLALGWVGGNRIISLGDGTTEANICKDNYEETKKAVLEDADWTFAISHLTPAPESVAYSPEFNYSFLLPSSELRVLSVSNSLNPAYANNIDWYKENKRIVCNYNIIYVKYIKNIDDPNVFSSLFTQALSARMAADFAIPLAKSRSLQADMWKLYENKLDSAVNRDGLQGRSRKIKSSWLAKARNR